MRHGVLQWCRYCRIQMQLKVDNVLREPMCCSYQKQCAWCKKIKHKNEFRRGASSQMCHSWCRTKCDDCAIKESAYQKRKREEKRNAEREYWLARARKRKPAQERERRRMKKRALEREQLERLANDRDLEAKKKAEAEGLVWTAPPPRRYKTCKECKHKRPEYEFHRRTARHPICNTLFARCIGCRNIRNIRRHKIGSPTRYYTDYTDARIRAQIEAARINELTKAQVEAARIEAARIEAERIKEELEEREAARWIKARTSTVQKMCALRAKIKREAEEIKRKEELEEKLEEELEEELEAARWIRARKHVNIKKI